MNGVIFNSGAASKHYAVGISEKKLEFSIPSNGWTNLKYRA